MYLVAISNPSKKFNGTRHNLGRDLVNTIASDYEFDGDVGEKEIKFDDESLRVLVHEGFMNESGKILSKVLKDVALDEIILIHDDLDIDFGEVKLSFDKNSGGHKGVQSVIDELKSKEFFRFRVGIGKDEYDEKKDYVLEKYSAVEKQVFEKLFKERVVPALKLLIKGEKNEAMKVVNT